MNQEWNTEKVCQKHLGYGHPSSLNYYINTRKLRDEAAKLNVNFHRESVLVPRIDCLELF